MTDFLPFTRPTIDEDMIAAVADVLRSGWIASGPQVQSLESELAAYLGGQRHVRTLTSATGALEIALRIAGVGPGDTLDPCALFCAAGDADHLAAERLGDLDDDGSGRAGRAGHQHRVTRLGLTDIGEAEPSG